MWVKRIEKCMNCEDGVIVLDNELLVYRCTRCDYSISKETVEDLKREGRW